MFGTSLVALDGHLAGLIAPPRGGVCDTEVDAAQGALEPLDVRARSGIPHLDNRAGSLGGCNLGVAKPEPEEIGEVLWKRRMVPQGMRLDMAEELEDPVAVGKARKVAG